MERQQGNGDTAPSGHAGHDANLSDPGILRPTLPRADRAPEAGYRDQGPAQFEGPEFTEEGEQLAVFQWDIDPHDPAAESGEMNIELGDWEFRVWWQIHPERLVYASIQAMRGDWVEHAGTARAHPVGRSEAVNLVYDRDRKAVVAIYGTVRDFRPFVDAFNRTYVLGK